MRKVFSAIGFVILFTASGLYAAPTDKIFTSSGQILTGEEWANVFIYNDDTIVDMLGGLVDSIATYDASTVNITGGHVMTVDALDSSTINVISGYVYVLFGKNQSTITLSGSASGTTFGVEDWSTLNVLGGTLNYLGAMEQGTINISSVVINDSISASDLSTVNIIGQDLFKVSTGGHYGYGQVYGFWFDDTPFTIDLNGSETFSHINLIPEPCSLILLAMGSMFLKRKK
jgi:hypothetical protein